MPTHQSTYKSLRLHTLAINQIHAVRFDVTKEVEEEHPLVAQPVFEMRHNITI